MLALGVVLAGNVDFVARIISMFFMVTYGALCSISFLEHFAANPSYRPTFRSRPWISLVGAVTCVLLMFQMDPIYAVMAIIAMFVLYWLSRFSPAGATKDLTAIFRGVMAQAARQLSIRVQRNRGPDDGRGWRPSIITVSDRTFEGISSSMTLLGWLCDRHGFGTYVHFVAGMLDERTHEESQHLHRNLLQMVNKDVPGVFVDTVVSPSYRTALAQALQLPGVSGAENNSVLFAMTWRDPPEVAEAVVQSALFTSVTKKNLLVLRSGTRNFGKRRSIHIWLNWNDTQNATLMTLLAYILVGHKDWRRAQIVISAAFPGSVMEERRGQLEAMMETGRLPIRKENVHFYCVEDADAYHQLVETTSAEADLVILGLTTDRLAEKRGAMLTRYPQLSDVLFVAAAEEVLIT